MAWQRPVKKPPSATQPPDERAATSYTTGMEHSPAAEEAMIPVALDAALEAFILEHEFCGELDGGVEGDCVWMSVRAGQRSTETRTVSYRRSPASLVRRASQHRR
jgi:hypothetical protein